MDSKEQLLREYDALEDQIDATAFEATWALADWLATKVPNPGPGANIPGGILRLSDVAERRGRSAVWLGRMRRVAETTLADRLSEVSVRAYEKALSNANWNLVVANAALRRNGTRLRDQSGPMESVAALQAQLDRRTPGERATVAAALLADPETRHEVTSTPIGMSGIIAAHRDVVVREMEVTPHSEPLPHVPQFTTVFWGAVRAVDTAADHMERYGVNAPLEADAAEAAERLRRRAGEIGAAVTESIIETSLER